MLYVIWQNATGTDPSTAVVSTWCNRQGIWKDSVFRKCVEKSCGSGSARVRSVTHTGMDSTHGLSSVLTFVRKGFSASMEQVFHNPVTLMTLLKHMGIRLHCMLPVSLMKLYIETLQRILTLTKQITMESEDKFETRPTFARW